jgi:hypothetical protein
MLLKLGKTFFNKKIIQTLRQKAVFNITEIIEKNRLAINAQLSKKITDGVFSQGTLTNLKVLALVTGSDQLEAQTCTRANIAIILNKMF